MTTPSSPAHSPCRRPGVHRRFFARAGSNTSGAVAVEFGFMVPVLAFMVVSVTDIGLAVYRKMQVENAAQAGAQYAMMHGFDATAISNAVISATNSSAISASPVPTTFCGCATSSGPSTISCGTSCPGGALAATYTTVSAQATYTTTMDYVFLASSYTFSKQSTVRLQ